MTDHHHHHHHDDPVPPAFDAAQQDATSFGAGHPGYDTFAGAGPRREGRVATVEEKQCALVFICVMLMAVWVWWVSLPKESPWEYYPDPSVTGRGQV